MFFIKTIREPPARVFLVDSSDSMVKNFDYIKTEIIRVVGELDSYAGFSIIFFADRTMELTINGKTGLFQATRENKRTAQDWVRSYVPGGRADRPATEQAIRRAFELAALGGWGLTPSIILINDGLLEGEPDRLIAELQKQRPAVILAFCFVEQLAEGEKMLREIGKWGRYRVVPAGTQPDSR